MTEAVLYDCKDGLAHITLNRPDARNALNSVMCEALVAATRRAREDGARCVLVQAMGSVFCAGADLKERQGMGDDAIRARRLKAFAAYEAVEHLPMPAIAVVEGPAVGSGVEIAAACDFIIATPSATPKKRAKRGWWRAW
ncbi:MAG: enoyl-CoA hydratase/isomerase family protein [Acetobacteraceae bacterium]|nr:enoyl-CoA hydratase/isomerase family protein [Acetobacteraceae bacterium]